MKKWFGSLLILISLTCYGQSVFAIEAQNQSSFSVPSIDQLKIITSPKQEKIKDVQPKEVENKTIKKIEKAKLEIQKSFEGSCKLWWQFALISSVFLLLLLIFAKTRPQYLPNKWLYLVYLAPISVGYLTWILHDYYHFHVKKYEMSFLCFNYWMIIGFEIFFFTAIYLLIFGFSQTVTKNKPKTKKKTTGTKKVKKKKSKNTTKKPAKVFDKKDAV